VAALDVMSPSQPEPLIIAEPNFDINIFWGESLYRRFKHVYIHDSPAYFVISNLPKEPERRQGLPQQRGSAGAHGSKATVTPAAARACVFAGSLGRPAPGRGSEPMACNVLFNPGFPKRIPASARGWFRRPRGSRINDYLMCIAGGIEYV
jgi:hypothetical protein